MSARDDGGPAFPHEFGDCSKGMSLRDYFAGQALQGMLGSFDLMNSQAPAVAKLAYVLADVMLAERAK